MLPTKVLQLDYQDFSNLVWDHFDLIEEYQEKNKLIFNGVVAKLRNGTIPGSIIANHFRLPMGVVSAPRNKELSDYEIFLPQEFYSLKENPHLLYVDSISGTGKTTQEIKEVFTKKYGDKFTLHTYSTLVDEKSNPKPNICGLIEDKFFQPPWEWRSFTAETHLDRLLHNDIKSSEESSYYVGISSDEGKDLLEQFLGKKIQNQWVDVFNGDLLKVNTTSGVSSLELPIKSISIELCKTILAPLIKAKAEFIQKNGITHFIETDISQAIVLSEMCPVSQIIFFDGYQLSKLKSKVFSKNSLLSLNF